MKGKKLSLSEKTRTHKVKRLETLPLVLCTFIRRIEASTYSRPTRKLFYRDARCIVCTKRRRMFYRLAFVLTARKVTYTFSADLRIFKKL